MTTACGIRTDPSVIDVTLADLEVAAAYLGGAAGAFQPKNRGTCEDFARRIAAAAAAGCRIQVLGDGADRMPYEDLWTIPILEAPEPWRSRALRALRILCARHGLAVRADEVSYLL